MSYYVRRLIGYWLIRISIVAVGLIFAVLTSGQQ